MRYALFDMSSQATSFNFLLFCVISKSQCKAMGEKCHVVFKKGPNRGFKEPHDSPYSLEEKQFRMTHVMYPICTLMGLDYSTDAEILSGVDESHIFGHEGRICLRDILDQYERAPLFWPQPSDHAMAIVRKQFPEPPVVMTLRETYSSARNSEAQEWIKFAAYVYNTNNVVFVRDTERWNDDLVAREDPEWNLEPFTTFPLASMDVDIRLALYKHAKINFSVGGGCTTLLRLSKDIPYRTFKYMRDESKISESKHSHPLLGNAIHERDLDNPIIKAEMNKTRHVAVSRQYLEEQLRQGHDKLSFLNSEGSYTVLTFNDSGKNKKYKGAASLESLTNMGFPPGSQFPWHTENQKLVWELDTFENMRKEYDDWLKHYGSSVNLKDK